MISILTFVYLNYNNSEKYNNKVKNCQKQTEMTSKV